MHAVAVLVHVLRDLAAGCQRRGEDEPDVVLDQHVAGSITDAGLQPRVGDRGEAPQGPIVGGRLLGVADPELDVVDAFEGEEILRLAGGVGIDDGSRLVGGAARDGLCHVRFSVVDTAGWGCRRSTVGAAVRATSIILSTAADNSSGNR